MPHVTTEVEWTGAPSAKCGITIWALALQLKRTESKAAADFESTEQLISLRGALTRVHQGSEQPKIESAKLLFNWSRGPVPNHA